MLRILEHSLNPDKTLIPQHLKDPILISIDVSTAEQNSLLKDVGIAYLDSRFLASPGTVNAVSTRLLKIRRRGRQRGMIRPPEFLFGERELCPPDTIYDILQTTFRQVDEEQGGLRNVFLVGHGITSDVHYLKKTIGFDLGSMPSITAIIDTRQLFRSVFMMKTHESTSLKDTMQKLGFRPGRHLHNSGNDAMFTLKVVFHLLRMQHTAAVERSEPYVQPLSYFYDKKPNELLWRERLDLLKQAVDCYPTISSRERRQANRRPKPPRVDKPDLLDTSTTSDEEPENVLACIFGDELCAKL
jgi:hypothetical protein